MIIKSFELKKINSKKKKFYFYGKNEGQKKEIIENVLKNFKKISNYEEK